MSRYYAMETQSTGGLFRGRKPARRLDAGELMEYALRALSRRALSVGEMRSKLEQKAADAADVGPVVERLKEYGCVDDSRMAESLAAIRKDSSGLGRQRVLRELRVRRVPGEVAARAVEKAYEDTDETAMATAWLERKYRGGRLQELLADPAKLASAYRRLRYAGFSGGAASRALKAFNVRAEELAEELSEDE